MLHEGKDSNQTWFDLWIVWWKSDTRKIFLIKETIIFRVVNFEQTIEINLSCREAFMNESQLSVINYE